MELKEKIEIQNKQIDSLNKEVDCLYKKSDIHYKTSFLFVAIGGGAFFYSMKFFDLNTPTYLGIGIMFLLIACVSGVLISFEITKLFIISSEIDKLKNKISDIRIANEN